MTEQELRALVRDAIVKQMGRRSSGEPDMVPAVFLTHHPSHGQFAVPSGGDACIIEPSVACTHCGYCKSYGH
jgi:hypothetical protein